MTTLCAFAPLREINFPNPLTRMQHRAILESAARKRSCRDPKPRRETDTHTPAQAGQMPNALNGVGESEVHRYLASALIRAIEGVLRSRVIRILVRSQGAAVKGNKPI